MFTRLSSVVCAAVLAGCSSSTNPAPQAAPGSVQAQACGRRAIEITWDQPAANLTAVAIERSRDGGPFESVAGTAADATSYVDYGLDAGTSYSYRLANINGAGASTYSSIVSATASSPDLILVSVVNPSGEFQLAVTSADQPQSTRLITPPSGLQFRLVDPRLHDDDRLILYVAGPESQPAESQVFAVPVCGDAPPRELTPPNANSTFEVYDDRYMVALTRSSLTTELMSVDLRGTDTVLLTSAPGGTQTFRWDPNARLGNGDLFFGDGDIWAVPVDGSAPPRPFGLGTPWPEQFATDANGNVLTLPDAVAVPNPSGIPSSSDRLVLARDGGETFLDQSGQNAQLTSLSIVANHLVWVRRASGIGQADISLRSGDTTQPRRVLTPNSIIQWDGLRNGLDLVFTMGSTLRPAPVMGLYSVPITGATAPTLLTTGAPTELSVIANVGDTVVYTRSSSPGAAFTCRIGGPMSEASIATSGVIDGSSAVFAAEGGQERAAQAVILRNVTTVGANTYTDFWSVTEDSAGA
ncbi:MAG: hypothetical protein AB8H79_20530, partial [Myxococcota bacterium]